MIEPVDIKASWRDDQVVSGRDKDTEVAGGSPCMLTA